MNTCNSANSKSLGKLLQIYDLTPNNKQKVIISAQRKTATWSGLHRLARKLEFIQSSKDQKNQINGRTKRKARKDLSKIK